MKKIVLFLILSIPILSFAQEPQKKYQVKYQIPTKANFDPNPFVQLKKVIAESKKRGNPYPNVGTMATATVDCTPYARTLTIAKIVPEGLVFFTNTDTGKWRQLQENQKASFVINPYHHEDSCVVINGVVDLNYNDPMTRTHSIVANAQELTFEWRGFLLKPTEIEFRGEICEKDDLPYKIAHSYVYKKGANGAWLFSENVKYYAIPVETDSFNRL